MSSSRDVVIVGGGIAGGALATVLARTGLNVLVLEKTEIYRDLVRGEWVAPWGVIEAKKLGIYDTLVAAGGHHLSHHVSAGDEFDSFEESEKEALDMTALLPGVPGPLCLQHTVACQALTSAAAAAGATVLRGVTNVSVAGGPKPLVRYTHQGVETSVSCRLAVGADGRNSVVRTQAGIELHRNERHHLFSGMLVEGAHGWPEHLQAKGTEGEVNYLVFPQGGGRVRLYLGYGLDRKSFLAGPDAQRRFLDAFRLSTLKHSEALANATPISHCYSYPNEDTWTDSPAVEGVVLVGDAAGHNDPIIGQGLSISFRDVRLVNEALSSTANWNAAIFAGYAAERAERMRRLRFAARLAAVIDSEFGPEAAARRRRVRALQAADPSMMLPTLGVMVGPENVPEFAYTEDVMARLVNA